MAQSERPSIYEVHEAICRIYKVDRSEIRNTKSQEWQYHRRMMAWAMRELTTASQPEIAEVIGYKGTSAVRDAIRDFPVRHQKSLLEADCILERIQVEIAVMRKEAQ